MKKSEVKYKIENSDRIASAPSTGVKVMGVLYDGRKEEVDIASLTEESFDKFIATKNLAQVVNLFKIALGHKEPVEENN